MSFLFLCKEIIVLIVILLFFLLFVCFFKLYGIFNLKEIVNVWLMFDILDFRFFIIVFFDEIIRFLCGGE